MEKLAREMLNNPVRNSAFLVFSMKGTIMFKQLTSLLCTCIITLTLLSGCGSGTNTSNLSGSGCTATGTLDAAGTTVSNIIVNFSTGTSGPFSGTIGGQSFTANSATYTYTGSLNYSSAPAIAFTDQSSGATGNCTVMASGGTSGGNCATGYTYIAGVGCQLSSGGGNNGGCATGYTLINGSCQYGGGNNGGCATGYTLVNGSCQYGGGNNGGCATGYTLVNGYCQYGGGNNGGCATGYTLVNGSCQYGGGNNGGCAAGYTLVNGYCQYGQANMSLNCSLIPINPSQYAISGVPVGFQIVGAGNQALEPLKITSMSDGEPIYTQFPYLLTNNNSFGVSWASRGQYTLSMVLESASRPGVLCNGGQHLTLLVNILY